MKWKFHGHNWIAYNQLWVSVACSSGENLLGWLPNLELCASSISHSTVRWQRNKCIACLRPGACAVAACWLGMGCFTIATWLVVSMLQRVNVCTTCTYESAQCAKNLNRSFHSLRQQENYLDKNACTPAINVNNVKVDPMNTISTRTQLKSTSTWMLHTQ